MERRRDERVRVSINIDWGADARCLWQGRITTLSVGGCFIQTPRELKAGERIHLRVWLAAGGERILRGEIRYCMERVGLGVQFFEVMERDKERLAELVEHYCDAPQSPPDSPGQTF